MYIPSRLHLLRKRHLLHCHALRPLIIRLKLIHVQRERNPLYLFHSQSQSLNPPPLPPILPPFPHSPSPSSQTKPSSKNRRRHFKKGKLTSIKQKLASPPPTPVPLPGFTKNLSPYSYASNRPVPPQQSTSTSNLLASASNASASPGTTTENPSRNPILRLPCVTTPERGSEGASASNRPRTSLRSGEMERR